MPVTREDVGDDVLLPLEELRIAADLLVDKEPSEPSCDAHVRFDGVVEV